MWRLAGYVYRAFRNTAAHRCSQDALIPSTTVCNNDDETNRSDEQNILDEYKYYTSHVLKQTQLNNDNFEQLQERLRKNFSLEESKSFTNTINTIRDVTKRYILRHQSIPEVQSSSKSSPESIVSSEETFESLLKTDQTCMDILKNLTDLHENTTSIINNQLAIDALETGNYEFGIKMLQASVKNDRNNPTALFNLGICYERGIGVEQDRTKACDYYRQASVLGHLGAQFNLSLLSNHIDIYDSDDDDDDEIVEKECPTVVVKEPTQQSSHRTVRFSFATNLTLSSDDQEQQSSSSDYHFDLNRTIACV